MTQDNKLAERWVENMEPAIKGTTGDYKIERGKFLGRGGFGIVHVAIRRSRRQGEENMDYEEVVLKEFKKSEKWKGEEDWDRQLVVLKTFIKKWDSKYVLDVIDIFQLENRKFYLVTKYASGGSLSERIKGTMKEDDVIKFVLRSAHILHYLHVELMRGYRSREKGQEQKESMGIVHRDFKPANLVFLDGKDVSSMYLIDFGIAKVGYTNLPKSYSNCGTSNYKAPEISDPKVYNTKVDIYSFGCTLYEIFSGGEKLLGTTGTRLYAYDRQAYIRGRLVDLENRLIRASLKYTNSDKDEKKVKFPLMWIHILNSCLQMDPKVRWGSAELLSFIEKSTSEGYNSLDKKFYFGKVEEKERVLREKRDLYQLNFQIYRMNVIQDIVFSIFEYYYFEQPRLAKFVLYVVLKYLASFVGEKYVRAKERAKLYDKTDKYQLIKKLVDDKRVEEIRTKANGKIRDELNKEMDAKGKSRGYGPIEEMVSRYPELLKEGTSEPRRTLYEFCYQKKEDLVENKKFGEMVGCAVLMMDEMDSYDDVTVDYREFEKTEVEVLSLRRLFKFKMEQEKKIEKQGLLPLFAACQVEQSVKTGMNKEEARTDVAFEEKK